MGKMISFRVRYFFYLFKEFREDKFFYFKDSRGFFVFYNSVFSFFN